MHQINNTNNTHENVLSMSKYKTNINFLPLHQNQKIWPLFCKNILKIKEKYHLGIIILMKLSKFQDLRQICVVVKVILLPCEMNNYIVRSYIDVIVVTKIATRRTIASIYSYYKTFIINVCAFGLDNYIEGCLLMFQWVMAGK